MKACGLIVEYNPFHNGHVHHVEEARKKTDASVIIAVMSGSFLQRGEPAFIDKHHRTKAALQSGVDIVVELPYAFAVQSSNLFAQGAVQILHALNVAHICFGSESGNTNAMNKAVTQYIHHESLFSATLKKHIQKGLSYPKATEKGYEAIGMDMIDMKQPNNILGFHYIKTILKNKLPIEPVAIQRLHNHYHDESIEHSIASATSIRKSALRTNGLKDIKQTIPPASFDALRTYKTITNTWHSWEAYFPYLYYKLITTETKALQELHSVDEGIEHRLKKYIHKANNFEHFVDAIRTNRYTTARIQRMCTHILTNTTKQEIDTFISEPIPYIRLLGMNQTGQQYIRQIKKQLNIPIISNLNKKTASLLYLDEKTTNVYYSIFSPKIRESLRKQEFQLPLIL